jgi:tripartite-type tricarboxylate transporter receptor subunit TctC
MKKLLTVIIITAAAISVSAKDTIQIIYGFGAGDNTANHGRNIAEEANKLQDKYNFIFDVKPGGGQVIATNYVKNNPNAIFMTGSAFWVRPNIYPSDSYNPNDFRSIMTMCSAPFSVASTKYKDWKSVPKDRPLNIATSGLGVISHLVAIQVSQNYPNMTIIPFKSTAEAVVATIGGQVDFVVGFIADAERFPELTILGTTGYAGKKYPTLSSQGFAANLSKMSAAYSLMVPPTWSQAKASEIRKILLKAETADSVRNSYKLDHCEPFQVTEDKLDTWWTDQFNNWKQLTSGVKVN